MEKEPLPTPQDREDEEHTAKIKKEIEQLGIKDEAGGMRWLHDKEHEVRIKAEEEAVTDKLTGLPNRRGFERDVKRITSIKESREAEKRQFPSKQYQYFSILEVDIDHFKSINDTYGHDAGDEVLKEVARHLKEGLRGDDVVARQGGEEFAFLLPNATAEGAQKRFGEWLNKKPMEIEVKKSDGTKETIEVTVSGGIQEFKPGEDFAEAYAAADKALYHAKKTGRNKIVIAGLEEETGEE